MKNYKMLSEIRIARGFSAKDVAKLINVAPNTLSQYENGVCEPSIDTLAKLAEIYNVNIENIVIPNDDSILLTKNEYEELKAFKMYFVLKMKCYNKIKKEYFSD